MYDQVPWGEQGAFSSGLDAILGIARLYGAGGNVRDVLDLGCGGGGTLLQIADDVPGRLVGVDLSPQSCELARAQLAPHGDRARIICGDLLSLEPEDLGQFDMIYLVGVLYILPPSEHQALLVLAARCLRPGGLLIVSYYSGRISNQGSNPMKRIRSSCRYCGKSIPGVASLTFGSVVCRGDPRKTTPNA